LVASAIINVDQDVDEPWPVSGSVNWWNWHWTKTNGHELLPLENSPHFQLAYFHFKFNSWKW